MVRRQPGLVASTQAPILLALAACCALGRLGRASAASNGRVEFDTDKGRFVVEVHAAWSPRAAARFQHMVRDHFFTQTRFHHIEKDTGADGRPGGGPTTLVQFGFAGDKALQLKYSREFPDDVPLEKMKNVRGMVSFMADGPDGRTTQLCIHLADNSARFDEMPWMTPFGSVVEGMDVVERLSTARLSTQPEPDAAKVQALGNSYLLETYPEMSFIRSTKVVGWTREEAKKPLPSLDQVKADLGSATAASKEVLAGGKTCGNPPTQSYFILKEYVHDPKCFSQAFTFMDNKRDQLFETCGLYKKSRIRKVDLDTGADVYAEAIDPRLFAEGATIRDGKMYMLTWRELDMLVYQVNAKSGAGFKALTTVKGFGEQLTRREGWGLTGGYAADSPYYVTDGSNKFYVYEPTGLDNPPMKLVKTITVSGKDPSGKPINKLNEIEFIDGSIYFNIWYSNYIGEYDLKAGCVVRWLDFNGLLQKTTNPNPRPDVLNGIAWHDQLGEDQLVITGKQWGSVFEVQIVK